MLTCRRCAAEFPRRPEGQGRQKLYCDSCWEQLAHSNHRDWDPPCLVCGGPRAYNRSYCLEHVPAYQPAEPRVCPCGKVAAGRSWYCSPECRAAARAEASRRRAALPSRIRQVKDRDRRRTAAKNAEDKPSRYPRWSRARRLVLADRPPCGICGEAIDYGLRFPDPMSPSVDHIVSWRQGGAWYDLDNLQAAHFRCNAAKRMPGVAS